MSGSLEARQSNVAKGSPYSDVRTIAASAIGGGSAIGDPKRRTTVS
jgi:hypothetical protein